MLERFAEVEAAFLFGSRAEGRERAGSDVDVGVVLGATAAPDVRLGLQQALVAAGVDDVDLVVLNAAPPVLRYEAVRPNCLVFARATFDRGSYVSRALREYFDLLPLLRWQREAMKRRLRGTAS